MSAFEEFGLHPSIICAVEDLDWTLPTPVQAEAVPLILGNNNKTTNITIIYTYY